FVTSPTMQEWSPTATSPTTRPSTHAAADEITGLPVSWVSNAWPLIVLPSTFVGLKNANASAFWPLARKERANVPLPFRAAYTPLSALTPIPTSGGLNDVCVTQLTVPAPTVSPCFEVRTYSP